MFRSISELVEKAKASSKSIANLMIDQEVRETGAPIESVRDTMRQQYQVMKEAVYEGIKGVTTHSGLCGHDARRLWEYINKGNYLTDTTTLKAACYAIATNEVNASMGVICATPTAGSCGIVPGVMVALQEKYNFTDDEIVDALFVAGAFGYVIANNAFISGAAGGCQAEIGSASAMAASAIVSLMGGSPTQSANAMAMAMKNMLGLTCDPLAGLVEVPCIKRNASGAVNALLTAELALADIESKVPWDEVISTMYVTGKHMSAHYRETALGGLAVTPTGLEWKKKLWIK